MLLFVCYFVNSNVIKGQILFLIIFIKKNLFSNECKFCISAGSVTIWQIKMTRKYFNGVKIRQCHYFMLINTRDVLLVFVRPSKLCLLDKYFSLFASFHQHHYLINSQNSFEENIVQECYLNQSINGPDFCIFYIHQNFKILIMSGINVDFTIIQEKL